MNRRRFFATLVGGVAVGMAAPVRLVAEGFAKLKKPLTEWRALLAPAAYDVLFEEATERPRSSALNAEKRAGTFICAACYLPLFDASTKYESGTGWPSFTEPIEGRMETKRDWKLILPRNRISLCPLRGSPGPPFQRWSGPNRTAMVQQRGGAAVRAQERGNPGPPYVGCSEAPPTRDTDLDGHLRLRGHRDRHRPVRPHLAASRDVARHGADAVHGIRAGHRRRRLWRRRPRRQPQLHPRTG